MPHGQTDGIFDGRFLNRAVLLTHQEALSAMVLDCLDEPDNLTDRIAGRLKT